MSVGDFNAGATLSLEQAPCPICEAASSYAITRDGCRYFQCPSCEFLFHRPELGRSPQATATGYDESYWDDERAEALRREREDCFLRALELIYLGRWRYLSAVIHSARRVLRRDRP